MPGTTVRIRTDTARVLRELARRHGATVQETLDRAIEQYRKQCFFESLDAEYAAMQDDPDTWKEEMAERASLDGTLADGLDSSESWSRRGDG